MTKCEYCGEEIVLPFKCPYCEGYFCSEHRLPEKHECLFLPKQKFWYQKQRKALDIKELKRAEKYITEKKSSIEKALKEAGIAAFVIALLIIGSIFCQ